MIWSLRAARPSILVSASLATAALFTLSTTRPPAAAAQGEQTGSIGGTVVDDQGIPLAGAQVAVPGSTLGTQTRANGEYVLPRVPSRHP